MKKIRTVVIEDEAVTARNLIHLLSEVDADIDVVKTLASVAEAVIWLAANTYELIFMDIRLADGLSFDIFKQVEVNRPVIFVTAYNDYAITAFKNNGIDYILKPFDKTEICNAVSKYKTWMFSPNKGQSYSDLVAALANATKSFKKSFLVHYRDKLLPIETDKISCFYTANEIVYANTTADQQYIIECTIEQLVQELDPDIFFRANRQFLINKKSIIEVNFYFNGRLSILIKPQPTDKILISKARVPEFKKWMNS